MATSKINYLGQLRTEATHLQSNNKLITDAPVDNKGMGENFSPTDLVATALGSCALTIMGIAAQNHEIIFENATVTISKVMGTAPRRITEIKVEFTLPVNLNTKERTILENAARTCPVAMSLSADLKQNLIFIYA